MIFLQKIRIKNDREEQKMIVKSLNWTHENPLKQNLNYGKLFELFYVSFGSFVYFLRLLPVPLKLIELFES